MRTEVGPVRDPLGAAHWRSSSTTDTKWDLDKAHPAASRADIDYLLERVNTVLKEPLDHDDVEGVYAGLRPLLLGVRPTSRISREHTVVRRSRAW